MRSSNPISEQKRGDNVSSELIPKSAADFYPEKPKAQEAFDTDYFVAENKQENKSDAVRMRKVTEDLGRKQLHTHFGTELVKWGLDNKEIKLSDPRTFQVLQDNWESNVLPLISPQKKSAFLEFFKTLHQNENFENLAISFNNQNLANKLDVHAQSKIHFLPINENEIQMLELLTVDEIKNMPQSIPSESKIYFGTEKKVPLFILSSDSRIKYDVTTKTAQREINSVNAAIYDTKAYQAVFFKKYIEEYADYYRYFGHTSKNIINPNTNREIKGIDSLFKMYPHLKNIPLDGKPGIKLQSSTHKKGDKILKAVAEIPLSGNEDIAKQGNTKFIKKIQDATLNVRNQNEFVFHMKLLRRLGEQGMIAAAELLEQLSPMQKVHAEGDRIPFHKYKYVVDIMENQDKIEKIYLHFQDKGFLPNTTKSNMSTNFTEDNIHQSEEKSVREHLFDADSEKTQSLIQLNPQKFHAHTAPKKQTDLGKTLREWHYNKDIIKINNQKLEHLLNPEMTNVIQIQQEVSNIWKRHLFRDFTKAQQKICEDFFKQKMHFNGFLGNASEFLTKTLKTLGFNAEIDHELQFQLNSDKSISLQNIVTAKTLAFSDRPHFDIYQNEKGLLSLKIQLTIDPKKIKNNQLGLHVELIANDPQVANIAKSIASYVESNHPQTLSKHEELIMVSRSYSDINPPPSGFTTLRVMDFQIEGAENKFENLREKLLKNIPIEEQNLFIEKLTQFIEDPKSPFNHFGEEPIMEGKNVLEASAFHTIYLFRENNAITLFDNVMVAQLIKDESALTFDQACPFLLSGLLKYQFSRDQGSGLAFKLEDSLINVYEPKAWELINEAKHLMKFVDHYINHGHSAEIIKDIFIRLPHIKELNQTIKSHTLFNATHKKGDIILLYAGQQYPRMAEEIFNKIPELIAHHEQEKFVYSVKCLRRLGHLNKAMEAVVTDPAILRHVQSLRGEEKVNYLISLGLDKINESQIRKAYTKLIAPVEQNNIVDEVRRPSIRS